MSLHPIVGTWALVATEWRRADGRHANPFGENATGIVIYDASGYMSAQVMRADRKRPTAGLDTGIESAMSSAFAGYIGYFGEYDIDDAAGTLTHRVIGSVFPSWVGSVQTRIFAIEGDRLTLSANVVSRDGVDVAASTVWERVV